MFYLLNGLVALICLLQACGGPSSSGTGLNGLIEVQSAVVAGDTCSVVARVQELKGLEVIPVLVKVVSRDPAQRYEFEINKSDVPLALSGQTLLPYGHITLKFDLKNWKMSPPSDFLGSVILEGVSQGSLQVFEGIFDCKV